MMNIGKPLMLAIGTLVELVSVAMANRPGYERIPNVDGRECVVNRWTGRVSLCDKNINGRKSR
ncbi:MAG: hypothetical protein NT102_07550 [Caldiserica bacterium]|nr:hypothetical protein [Caldisericota bacterium]